MTDYSPVTSKLEVPCSNPKEGQTVLILNLFSFDSHEHDWLDN